LFEVANVSLEIAVRLDDFLHSVDNEGGTEPTPLVTPCRSNHRLATPQAPWRGIADYFFCAAPTIRANVPHSLSIQYADKFAATAGSRL
jgi:hypothetical protein